VLINPTSVATDPFGNLYVTDSEAQVVAKVSPTGSISKFAGTFITMDYSGDGGPANSAALSQPEGLAIDSIGNVYIADAGNNRVRKVDASGTITTVAGNGTPNISGDGGPAISAGVPDPLSLTVDTSNNLYIVSGNRVRKVSPSGTITTIAGTGPATGFSGDGGQATSASFNFIQAIASDSAGNLYLADFFNRRVRKVSTSGVVTTIAGNGGTGHSGDGGSALTASIDTPYGVSVDSSGNVFIASPGWLRKVTSAGVISSMAGDGTIGYRGDGGDPLSAWITGTAEIAIGPLGRLFLADNTNARVRRVYCN
jgi:sugar lactone lactonase YvrE